jgi:K+-sensing histidine kinase KdpD
VDITLSSSPETAVPSLRFLSDMGHDLRSPLNGVINFAYLLRLGAEGELTPAQAETVARIEQNGHLLLDMLNDLLDLTRLDLGRLRLDVGPTAVSDLVQAGCQVEETPLTRQVAADLPLVAVDEARTRQALAMLTAYLAETRAAAALIVAAAAAPDGVEIRLTGREVGETAVAPHRLLAGQAQIDPALPRLDASHLRLVLSARLLAAQGGALHVSDGGADLTFTLHLPVIAPQQPPGDASSEQ